VQSSHHLRVLLYTREFPPFKGGAGNYCAHLAAALRSRKIFVHVLAPDYPTLPTEALPFDAGIVSRFSRSSAIRNAWQLMWVVIRHRISDVIIGDAGAIADYLEVPRPTLVRYSVVTHGTEILNFLHPLHSELDTTGRDRLIQFFHDAHAIIHNSDASLRLIEECGLDSQKCMLVYPAVEAITPPFPTPELAENLKRKYGLKDEPVVLSVARLDTDKGQDVLLRAFSRVLISHPDVKLIIVGDGPQHDSLKRLTNSLDIERSVCFAGQIPSSELSAHHELSSFFVMVSRSVDRFEGFGIVYIEAALCKRTSVAGNQGGVPEAVEDGVTGLLVDPTDTDDIAKAIIRLLDDPEYREILAGSAFERASDQFNLQRMAEQLLVRGGFATQPLPGLAEKTLGLAQWFFSLALVSLRYMPHALRKVLFNR